LIVEGFQLSGDGLRQPILVPRLVLEPMMEPVMSGERQKAKLVRAGAQAASGAPALVATMAVSGRRGEPAGGDYAGWRFPATR